MIEKFPPSIKPHQTMTVDVLIKTKRDIPYFGAYFSGYYCHSQNTWKVFTLGSDSRTGGTYLPINEEHIEHWIMLENDYIKEDKEKLTYCIKLLSDFTSVQMFASESGIWGIHFTDDYCKIEEEIQDFLQKEGVK